MCKRAGRLAALRGAGPARAPTARSRRWKTTSSPPSRAPSSTATRAQRRRPRRVGVRFRGQTCADARPLDRRLHNAHALPHSHQLLEQHAHLQRAVVAACPLSWSLVRHRHQPAFPAVSLACLVARHQALEFLAACPNGCAETLMVANGFTAEVLIELISSGVPGSYTRTRSRS
jgi:hypothetical protein